MRLIDGDGGVGCLELEVTVVLVTGNRKVIDLGAAGVAL